MQSNLLAERNKSVLVKSGQFFKSKKDYWLIIAMTLGVFAILYDIPKADLTVPFSYAGDGMFGAYMYAAMIKGDSILQNMSAGMPDGAFLYQFPMFDSFHLFILRIISLVFSSVGLTQNIYLILTYVFTSATALFVLKKLGLSWEVSVFGGLIYSFLPTHMTRGAWHLLLSGYYMIPLCVLLAMDLNKNEAIFFSGRKLSVNKRSIAYFLVCVITGLCGLNYAFFACFFFVVACLCVCINEKRLSLQSVLNSGSAILTVFLSVVSNVIPNLRYIISSGFSFGGVERSAAHAEILSIRIMDLILPITNHRIPFLARIRDYYNNNSTLLRDDTSKSSLGMVMAIGFCILLLMLLKKSVGKDLRSLSVFNVCALLLASTAGFSSLITYVFPYIQAYCRISVYIAFFSIACVCILLEGFKDKIKRRWAFIGLISLLLVAGLFEQTSSATGPFYNNTPSYVPEYEKIKAEFESDRDFVNGIEARIPAGAMVYQLPYQPFPEPPVSGTPDRLFENYSLMKGYVHSKTLKWSYGAARGTENDLWQQELLGKPVNDILDEIVGKGFSGLYIDRHGYSEGAAYAIEMELNMLLQKPLVSDNGRLIFYQLDVGQWAPSEITLQSLYEISAGKYQGNFEGKTIIIVKDTARLNSYWSQERWMSYLFTQTGSSSLKLIFVESLQEIAPVAGKDPLVVCIDRDTSLCRDITGEYSSITAIGKGTQYSPYVIQSAAHLATLRDLVNIGESFEGVYFRQSADIDLGGYENWVPIGVFNQDRPFGGSYFGGIYDGNGYAIYNLNCYSDGYQNHNGLFGFLDGTVTNLGIESGNVFGNCSGSMASKGSERAIIFNCYNKASVSGSRAGGFVDHYSGSIISCVNLGRMEAPITGGIASYSASYVENCYATTALVNDELFEGTISGGSQFGQNGVKAVVANLNRKLREYSAQLDIQGKLWQADPDIELIN